MIEKMYLIYMDIIQNKLELLDNRRYFGFKDGLGLIEQRAMVVFAALGVTIGIIVQEMLGVAVWGWFAGLVLLVLCCVAVFIRKKAVRGKGFILLLCFICLGAIRISDYRQLSGDNIGYQVSGATIAEVKGQIVSEPVTYDSSGWAFSRFSFGDPSSAFYMELSDIQSENGWVKTSGTVRVYVNGPAEGIAAGDKVRVYCELDRIGCASNPGQFDVGKYLGNKNIYVRASVKTVGAISVVGQEKAGLWRRIKFKVKSIATNGLLSDIESENSRGLIEALMLGGRGNVDNATFDAFRRTGLLHFISLSGLHFGILISIMWWICRICSLSKRWSAIVCIFGTILFLSIIHVRPPALRAGIISIVFFSGAALNRRMNSFNSLSLAGVILLLWRPTHIYEAGFQLSFVTVVGILLFTERLYFYFYDYVQSVEAFKRWRGFVNSVLLLLCTGFSAWMVSSPLLAYHFHAVTPLAALWTVMVFPFIGTLMLLGFLKIVLSLLLPSAGMVVGFVIGGIGSVMTLLVKGFAMVGVSEITVGKVSIWAVVLCYGLLIFWGFVYPTRRWVKRGVVIIGAAVLLTLVLMPRYSNRLEGRLTMTCLDVGDGQCVVVQTDGGETIVFDAGSMFVKDAGRRIVNPFLKQCAIRRIDKLFLSHFDTDHINAVPEVADAVKVEEIFANETFSERDIRPADYLQGLLAKKNKAITFIGKRDFAEGEVMMRLLWPDGDIADVNELSNNDTSIVTLIEYKSRRILLCSDIEQFAQMAIIEAYPELQADVVVMPHHGSVNTLAEGFIEGVGAKICISSCSASRYHKQSGREKAWVEYYYTAVDGAVTVSIGGDGDVEVKTFLK